MVLKFLSIIPNEITHTSLFRIMSASFTAGISNNGLVMGGSFLLAVRNIAIRLYGTTNQPNTTIAPRRNRLIA